MSKCYNLVKSELLDPGALPDVLDTLKLLFGRSEIIYHTLVAQLRSAHVIKYEKIQTVVTIAMRKKNMCGTLRSASMDYLDLFNLPLLSKLTKRLPIEMLRL